VLTTEFLEGYNSSQADIDNPYLWSSDAWLAYMAGADFAKHGTSEPVKAKKSFGYVIRVWTAGGNEFRVIYGPNYQLRAIERA
jgi:hypothetical protein